MQYLYLHSHVHGTIFPLQFQKAKLLPIESASIIYALDLGQCLKLPDTLQVKGDNLGVVITEFWEVSSLKDIQ